MQSFPWIFRRRTYRIPEGDLLNTVSMCVKTEGEGMVFPVVVATTFLIDWGDGCVGYEPQHRYEQAGTYCIRLVGSEIHALDVSRCCLTALQLEKCPALEHLNCAHNFLRQLDLSHNLRLQTLDCSDNALTALELKNKPELLLLDASHNRLQQLTLESCPRLLYLYVADNQLTEIEWVGCRNLYCVDIGMNGMNASLLNHFLSSLPVRDHAAIQLEQEEAGTEGKAYHLEMLKQKGWTIV